MPTTPSNEDESTRPMNEPTTIPDDTTQLDRPKTPQNSEPQPSHGPQGRTIADTPAKPHATHSHSYRNGTLDEKRESVLQDLGYTIPQLDTDFFVKTFLPPLKDGIHLPNIMTSLKQDGVLNSDGIWEAFQRVPAKSGLNEDKTFEPLTDIFNKVVYFANTSAPNLEQTLVMCLLPHVAPDSERESTTRPDGYFILKEAEDRVDTVENARRRWYDLALTEEFKLKDSDKDRDDNVTKIVYSMQHTMSLDPTRRFTFGITIENTSVRLWFCSRAIMAVSNLFDFITNPELLTHVFLSLAFADKTELGWDPTIRVGDRDDKRVYYIEVNGKTYETVEVLSDFGADAIIGRATRVFKVKLEGSDKLYVLKDVWVETDRELEHVIHNMILNDVETKFGEDARKEVASHLLTPVDHWLVTVNEEEDHTTKVMMRGNEPSFEDAFELVAKEPKINDAQKSTGPVMSTDREVHEEKKSHMKTRAPQVESRKKLHHRRHYRIVFEEVAEPIWTVMDLSDAFIVIRDCAKALKWIHKCGWIHRDISAGNVYLYLKRGLLGDLEYAKKVDTDGAHQMRTGTLDFMAVEVMLNRYAFVATEYATEVIEEFADTQDDISEQDLQVQDKARLPFKHNEAHDIESLWWLSIFVLFFNGDTSHEENSDQRRDRKLWTRRLFPRTVSINDRLTFLIGRDFEGGVAWFPPSFVKLKESLDLLRDYLVINYMKFERVFPEVDRKVFERLQDTAIVGFSHCANLASGIKLSSHKVTGKRKRKSESGPEVPTAEPDSRSSVGAAPLATPAPNLPDRDPKSNLAPASTSSTTAFVPAETVLGKRKDMMPDDAPGGLRHEVGLMKALRRS